MTKAVVILGPTGVGKSEFALTLAKLFNGEIISADSVQIYRGLDIGSAKIKREEMQGITHHCISILEPEEEFSVSEYVALTKQKIAEITARKHLPIIVGGTALYIKALKEGYDFGGGGKIQKLRDELNALGCETLFKMLQQKNPERATEISINDKKKLVRALEIEQYGVKPSATKPDLDLCIFAITMERQALYERINARADKMLESGLIEEVKSLKARGLSKQNQSMMAIGYKETLDYLDGKLTREELAKLIKQHSRNYAKRQMTFLRGMGVEMFDRSDEQKMIEKVRKFV